MNLARYFASSKKRDLSSEQLEAGDDIKKREREKIVQLQVSQRMMIFSWKD